LESTVFWKAENPVPPRDWAFPAQELRFTERNHSTPILMKTPFPAIFASLVTLCFLTSGLAITANAGQESAAILEIDSESEDHDTKLEESVLLQLKSDALLAGLSIEVTSAAGEITLSGEVETLEQKQRAEETTKGVIGVERVTNNLTVED